MKLCEGFEHPVTNDYDVVKLVRVGHHGSVRWLGRVALGSGDFVTRPGEWRGDFRSVSTVVLITLDFF